MPVEAPSPDLNLENHFLLFQTNYGALFGWNILTDLDHEEIDLQLQTAKGNWLSSEAGKDFLQKENIKERDVYYAHVMLNIPPEILAEHHIYPGTPVYEIIALDFDGLKAPVRSADAALIG